MIDVPIWRVKSALQSTTIDHDTQKSLQNKLYRATVLSEASDDSKIIVTEEEADFIARNGDSMLNG